MDEVSVFRSQAAHVMILVQRMQNQIDAKSYELEKMGLKMAKLKEENQNKDQEIKAKDEQLEKLIAELEKLMLEKAETQKN